MRSLLLVVAVLGAASGCKFPPHLWCSSPEIATQCKVYNQCQESVWTVDIKAAPVSVELYFESLCPFCREFITKQLYPTHRKIGKILNVTLVPYGNAQEVRDGDKWKFTCQHGGKECIGNILETCGLHELEADSAENRVSFVNCMEQLANPEKAVKTCAREVNISADTILQCSNSNLGNKLEHQMAITTKSLNPPHQYVPWVVLNGVHTEKINNEAQKDLLKLVCKTYKGPKPPACTQTVLGDSVCPRQE